MRQDQLRTEVSQQYFI